MTQKALAEYRVRTDALDETALLFDTPTVQTSIDIMRARQDDPNLRERSYLTANLGLFRIHNGQLQYGLGGRETFDAIAGRDIRKFSKQLRKHPYYRVPKDQTAQLDDLDHDIVWVDPLDLKLIRHSNESSFYEVTNLASRRKNLNQAKKQYASKAFGSTDPLTIDDTGLTEFERTLSLFDECRADVDGKPLFPEEAFENDAIPSDIPYNKREITSQTKMWVPTRKHVESYLEEGTTLALPCRIFNFGSSSSFTIDNPFYTRGMYFGKNQEMWMRGSLRKPTVDIRSIGKLAEALADPAVRRQVLDTLPPETARTVSRDLDEYLGNAQQKTLRN